MIVVEIKNAKEISDAFKKAPDKLKSELTKAINKSAFLVEREAKKLTPVRTGRLRASILVESFKERPGSYSNKGELYPISPRPVSELEALISPHTDYAIYVHDRIPFMTGGAGMADREIQQSFKQAVDNALKDL